MTYTHRCKQVVVYCVVNKPEEIVLKQPKKLQDLLLLEEGNNEVGSGPNKGFIIIAGGVTMIWNIVT